MRNIIFVFVIMSFLFSSTTSVAQQETLQLYVDKTFSNPKEALAGFEKFDLPASKVFQAYIYKFGLTAPANLERANKLMNEAIQQVSAGINRIYYSDVKTTETYTYEDDSLFFDHMREILRAAIETGPGIYIPKELFIRHGRKALGAFGPKWWSSLDIGPSTGGSEREDLKKLPQTLKYFKKLEGIKSCYGGTMDYGWHRQINNSELDMLYIGELNSPNSEYRTLPPYRHLRVDDYMLFWSAWGVWNFDYYTELDKLRITAEEELTDYYKNSFSISNPKERAADALERIRWNYLHHFKDEYHLAFYSLIADKIRQHTLTRDELNSFIKILLSLNSVEVAVTYYTGPVFLNMLILNDAGTSDIALLAKSVDTSFSGNESFDFIDPPMLAATTRPEILRILLKANGNANAQNAFGKTPLHTAIQQQNMESVKTLVKAGADINLPTFSYSDVRGNMYQCGHYALRAYNRTPLMYAAWQGTLPIIEYLVKNGANIDLMDSNRERAIDYLKKNEFLNEEERIKAERLLVNNVKQ